jgi:hypothetical protein
VLVFGTRRVLAPPMSLTGVTRHLTAAERAREPRSLGIMAWFDGHARAWNPDRPWATYPRRLNPAEARSWRQGWDEGRAEKRCHDLHGFGPHTPECTGRAGA